jgi:heme-degrading monooxygenase HmoA
MHARSAILRIPPDRIDEAIRALEALLSDYRAQSGYKGFTTLANRESSTLLAISFWATEADRSGSEDLGQRARDAIREVAGAEAAPARQEWEVALDDMP